MKKLVLTIFLLTAVTGYSQNLKPDSIQNDYSINYLGSWNWENGNDKFRIDLVRAELSNGIRLITGSYLYIVNKKEVVNASLEDGTFWIMGYIQKDSTELTIAIVDKVTGKNANATLTLLDNNTVKWKLNNAEEKDQNSPLSIPTDVTLRKQN